MDYFISTGISTLNAILAAESALDIDPDYERAVCQLVIHFAVAPASRPGRLLEFGPIDTTRSIRQIHLSLS